MLVMNPRVSFIWLPPCQIFLKVPLWAELENMVSNVASSWGDVQGGSKYL